MNCHVDVPAFMLPYCEVCVALASKLASYLLFSTVQLRAQALFLIMP